MIIKNTSKVGDIHKNSGLCWLGLKNLSTFYIKRTITYGTWNIVWSPDPIPDTGWSGGSVSFNAIGLRTNIVREGFTISHVLEEEYAEITVNTNIPGCSLSGTAGSSGYTYTWGEYNVTTADRTVTVTASIIQNGVTLITDTHIITQKLRDRYAVQIKDVIMNPAIIPAAGGTVSSIPYTYTVVYNTGDEEEKTGTKTITTVSATSKGTTESDITTVLTLTSAELGTITVDDAIAPFPDCTILQAANTKVSNNDAYENTLSLTLYADKSVVYSPGGNVLFNCDRIYDSYSDSYTWTSGAITPAVITSGETESLTPPDIYLIYSDGGSISGNLQGPSYTIPETTVEKTWTFQAKYKNASGVASNIITITQELDYKIEDSDTYTNLVVNLSYTYSSSGINYHFPASGGRIMSNGDRCILTWSYTHTWEMLVAGTLTETVSGTLADLSTSEYTFSPTSFTCPSLGTTEKAANTNVGSITVTVSPSGTGLSKSATATLTQAGNSKSTTPVAGSEVGVSLDVTASPTTYNYAGGAVTLKAMYTYTVDYEFSSGDTTTDTETKDVTTSTSWSYTKKVGSGTASASTALTGPSHTIESIGTSATDNVLYTYTGKYTGADGVAFSDTATVTQSADTLLEEYYENLVITAYTYETVSGLTYHIPVTGGTIQASAYKTLTATYDHYQKWQYKGEVTNTETVPIASCTKTYSPTSLTALSLATTVQSTNKAVGTFTITLGISGTGSTGTPWSLSKLATCTIYQLPNTRSLTKTVYSNVTASASPTTFQSTGGTTTVALTYKETKTYTYTSGSTLDEDSTITATTSAMWYLDSTSKGSGITTITIPLITGTSDVTYTIKATITLGGTAYTSNNVTITQSAKTISYYSNLSVSISLPYVSGTTYHIPASGGTAYSSDVTGTYSYTINWSDGTTSSSGTLNISTLGSTEKTFNNSSIPYVSKSTTTSDTTKAATSSSTLAAEPSKFIINIRPTGIVSSTGTQLTATADVTVVLQANTSTLVSNATTTTTGISISPSSDSCNCPGKTIAFTVTRTYTSTTAKYSYTSGATSGGVSTSTTSNVATSTSTTWSYKRGSTVVNLTSANNGSNKNITIPAYYVTTTTYYYITASYDGYSAQATVSLSNPTITITFYVNRTTSTPYWSDNSTATSKTCTCYTYKSDATSYTTLADATTALGVTLKTLSSTESSWKVTTYTSDGWATSSTGSVVATTTSLNSYKTFYGHWTSSVSYIQYEATWDVLFNDGLWKNNTDDDVTSYSSTADGKIYLLTNTTYMDPKKTGYTYIGFNTNPTLKVGLTFPQELKTNTVFYAIFTPNPYTITWNVTTNGGTWKNGTTANQTTTVDYDEYIYGYSNTTLMDPIRVTDVSLIYTYVGWSITASSTTGITGTTTRIATCTGARTIYAIFTGSIRYYTVTWNPNGGNWSSSTANKTSTVGYNLVISKISPDPTRTSYDFIGWNLSGTGSSSSDCSTFNTTTPKCYGDITYKAVWKSSSVTVTYVCNTGGSCSPTSQSVTIGSNSSTTVTPNTDYYINGTPTISPTSAGTVSVNTTTNVVTVTNVTGNCTVTISFAQYTYVPVFLKLV